MSKLDEAMGYSIVHYSKLAVVIVHNMEEQVPLY